MHLLVRGLNKLQNAWCDDKESEVLFVFNLYNNHKKYRCVKTVHKMNYSMAGVTFSGRMPKLCINFKNFLRMPMGNLNSKRRS